MILLFGEHKTKTSSTKNNHVKNNPVENSGVLAMSLGNMRSYLAANEYDTYTFSNGVTINYADFADCGTFDASSIGFMGEFSSAVACLSSDGGFSDGGFSGGCTSSCSSSCGSFSSFG